MRRSSFSVVAALTVALASAGSAPVRATEVSGSVKDAYHPGSYVLDPDTGKPVAVPSTRIDGYTGEMLTLQAAKVGLPASEPTIGVDDDGVAYFAASTLDVDRPQAWGVAMTHVVRSTDGGVSWTRVQQSVPAAQVSIPPGNLDPFVWVDQDTGRVFNLDLYGGCSWLNYSDTKGDVWLTNPAACGMPVNDHQTIGAGTPRGGYPTLLYPNILYYCANQVVQTGCGRSLDGGVTWAPTGSAPYPLSGGTPGCGGLTGHIRTDPEGRVFLPSGECVAISEDAGDTWTRVQALPLDALVAHTSVASDSAGNLYYVGLALMDAAYDQWLPFLTVSTDHGATWGEPMMIAPPDVKHANFPVISAGDEGRIAINFPGTTEAKGYVKATTWNQYVVVSVDALSGDPAFLSATANDPADPIHRGRCQGRCDGLWDFLDVTISAQGEAWASASDDCVANCVTPGDLVHAHVGDGIAIRQIGGPKLRG